MTRRRFDNRDTPFGDWVRNNPRLASRLGFDFQDLDHIYPNDFDDTSSRHKLYINHQYLHGRLMFVEEKQHKATRTPAQRDTFGILDQWCRHASGMQVVRQQVIEGEERPDAVIYWGWYVVQFENSGPQDGKLWINGKPATVAELELLLTFAPSMQSKFLAAEETT
jgi:hypothetical protein